ncbi:MAG: nitrous oxide reductase family maturation protein NosD [Balneolales bacterium]
MYTFSINKTWFAFLGFSLVLIRLSFAQPIFVGPDQELTSLKMAIEQASDGDTIIVKGGTYRESPLFIDKDIVLLGYDQPEIDGESKHQILFVKTDHVVINGFLFSNAGLSHTSDNAAIRLDGVKGGEIRNNTLNNNFFGIYLARTEGVQIIDNTIRSNAQRESTSANGIHLWNSKEILVSNNQVIGHRDGIYLENVDNSEVTNNFTEGNLRYGLHFMFSNDCLYLENTFSKNGAGVAVMYSDRVLMGNNRFVNNWGSSSYGLLLKDINESKIYNNHFENNTTAIRMEGTNRTVIKNNRFIRNGSAVRIMANSINNRIEQNNFIDNSFDVSTNSRRTNSSFRQNYWSSYTGYDLTGDGFGDVPFHPVRLFSLLIERNENAMILMRSLFVDILDIAERVFPVLTPEALVDEQPRMREWKL